MKWNKLGLVFAPDGQKWWNKLYGLTPTPWVTNEGYIRVYFATTDNDKFGRISFVDLSSDDPTRILFKSEQPILGPGEDGSFDDCGCGPACVLTINSRILLYYSGFQRSFKVPYAILTGLAISQDSGNSFVRHSTVPILERIEGELTIRSAPWVIKNGAEYWMWYCSASGWELMGGLFGGRKMPRYIIKRATSKDGINWMPDEHAAISYDDDLEFGFARPSVIRVGDGFRMWYSIRSIGRSYRIGFAESSDGLNWTRKDNQVGIDISKSGWDSEMICYPAVIRVKEKTYMFYNGNNNGETGFGVAELIEE